MAPRTDADTDHRPDYPPRTPPPPRKPPSPPAPEPSVVPGELVGTARRGVAMANRRGLNLCMDNYPWTTATARRRVLTQLHEWGHRPDADKAAHVITTVVGSILNDGGRRISIHLSDQGTQACILALSHQPDLVAGHDPVGDTILKELAGISIVSSCGTDTAPDGRRLWAVIDL
ncbi:hypothetical protein ABCR94_13560 [Streptomyces sp. 21So2-11]|uniref:hypothetical protein n=1 Tax=Streptomyces sp. 21So2-11 TaxID=3144408 RepID=UPI00321B2F31